MRRLVFEITAQEQLNDLILSEPKAVKKVFDLIADIQKHPFEGIGKPEALKHDLAGYCGAARAVKENH